MTFKLAQSSKALKKQRRSLLAKYDDEELHQLRVNLRRVRSALESTPEKKARRLRRDLGRLARATNSARDWDTLVACARRALTAAQFGELEPGLDARQAAARGQVYRMLGSRRWKTVVRRWKDYSNKAGIQRQPLADTRQGLEKVVKRSNRAIRKALVKDDDKHWHQLRIAIKKLRYTLEHMGERGQGPGTAQLIARCKHLQTELGDWHDTVVHRQLLEELFEGAGYEAGSAAQAAASALLDALALKRQQCLSNIKAELRASSGDQSLASAELLIAEAAEAGR